VGITDEGLAELFEQYKDEVRETIGTLDNELVSVERDAGNSEVIFSVFRHLHSLKGSSKMFNVDNIAHIAHKLEDLMQIIDKDNSILGRSPEIVNLLFRGNDIFREIMARLEDNISYVNLTPEHAQFIEEVNRHLDRISRSENVLLEQAQTLLDELEAVLPALEASETGALVKAMKNLSSSLKMWSMETADLTYSYEGLDLTPFVAAYEAGLKKFQSGRFEEEDISAFFGNAEGLVQALFDVAEEGIMGLLEELNDGLDMYQEKSLEVDPIVVEFFTTLLGEIKSQVKVGTRDAPGPAVESGGPPSEIAAAPGGAGGGPSPGQVKTIRVDERKIDLFLDSVGKLITQSEILNHLQHAFKEAGINPAIVRDFAAVNRTISNDIISLQRSIMEVRQVEIDNILKKFPRLVRDLSHKVGKEVELAVSGERTPIDKSLLDDVEAALIHIVRNALDHGLEPPEEREKSGKNRRGRIQVDVRQEEASVLIVVSDDGRGIDYGRVLDKAVERGTVARDQVEEITQEEIQALIFQSGITTKSEATDISGRGVGLDVVQSNIKKWNGDVTLKNDPGQGLKITISIPITNTLLTKEAILLRLAASIFCLPLEYVLEIVTVPRDKLHHHKSREVFQHREQVINVVNLKGILGLTEPAREDRAGDSNTFIILRGKKDSQQAILADEILGQQKIVIKDFELEAFRRLPYYLGLTLMGDGRAVLVLDAEKIVE